MSDKLQRTLLERFGPPMGDGQGMPTSTKKQDMGNRGFGSGRLGEEACCVQCGQMPMEMDAPCECDGHMVEALDEQKD